MTELDEQDRAADRAARELARRLRPITTLKDPDAAAADFMAWLRDEHWRCMPPPPDTLKPHAIGDEAREATRRGVERVRRALSHQEDQ